MIFSKNSLFGASFCFFRDMKKKQSKKQRSEKVKKVNSHIIVATDKKTGELRTFIFEGEFYGVLLVEEKPRVKRNL